MIDEEKLASSFRDPSGFIFQSGGEIYRQINQSYKEHYDCLMSSGLFKELVDRGLLIDHEEIDNSHALSPDAYKVIKPTIIPFISYPYEWCFSQLKDAALLTLRIQQISFKYNMSLKDCSAYNVQFTQGKPVFIDTLSFEIYREGYPWVAYKQFCQHFLAPLALMQYQDRRLNQLFRIYLDGLPLDLASSLLPLRTRLLLSIFIHIHLHARSQKYFSEKSINKESKKIGRLAFAGLIDSLKSAIRKRKIKFDKTEWSDYYDNTNYSAAAFSHKEQIVSAFLTQVKPEHVWDLGANEGTFSRLASRMGIPTISFDIDQLAVEKNYRQCVKNQETNLLPLLLDLTNPSPDIGWENQERVALLKRGPVDTVMALALTHHLALANNLPFNRIASFFAKICTTLIIEFIPKSDSQVKRMLATREDIFPDYGRDKFEEEFVKYFTIITSTEINDSDRVLYLMKLRQLHA
jgi:hypothetical protein